MSESGPKIYETELECEVCYERFGVQFETPEEPFEATCPHCDTHYPEVYV